MNPIMLVLAILLLMRIVPERHNENAEEKAALKVEMQNAQEKETVQDGFDHSDNDFSIYWHVIDINNL